MHIYLKWTLSLLLHKINTAFLADECRRSSFWFSLLCSASPRLAASLAPAPGCVPGLCTVVAARWWENKCCSFRDLFFFPGWNSWDWKQLLCASGRKPTGSEVRIKIWAASKIWDCMSRGFKLVKPGNSHFPVGRKKTNRWNLCKRPAELKGKKKIPLCKTCSGKTELVLCKDVLKDGFF